ncbi:hypothetical protein [Kordia sp.]|uniref:hypothetical protein n=1 Tax=Kordia sp. TaxID=1965332 RepID=UPI003D26AF77
MKKLCYFLLIGILFISCSSDDNQNNNPAQSLDEIILENSWFFQRHGEICSNGFDLDAGDPYEFRFLSNNTVEFTDPGYLTSSSYELNGNQLTLETIYTLPSGSMRKFIGNYTYSEINENFTGDSTFTAYNDTETLWTCDGTSSVFR